VRSSLRRILIFLVLFLTLALATIIVNQTLQLAEFADRFHPVAGKVVFWGLIVFYIVCLAVPIVVYQRLPAALKPPETDRGPEFERHLTRLKNRLAANPVTAELPLHDRSDIEQAISRLDGRAEELMKKSASRVFLATAISQNGSLDSLVVLAAQVKLVWDVAHIYCQRPGLREMGSLYANVLGTAFVAGQLEDIDLSEQLQPVLTTVFGSAAGAIPGMQAASTVALSSVITGSANAFLTLRVGAITKEYSGALVRRERRALRRSAAARAAVMLGSVVAGQAARVTGAIVKASGRSVGGVLSGLGSKVMGAGASLANRLPFGQDEVDDVDGGE
jgi:hypothetical protein